MNETLDINSSKQHTVGQVLKNTRETKNLSVEQVSKALLLNNNTVLALENDNYQNIAAQVYAEGYLKAYAKFLQMPSNDILVSFRALNIYDTDYVPHENKIKTKSLISINDYNKAFGLFKNTYLKYKKIFATLFVCLLFIVVLKNIVNNRNFLKFKPLKQNLSFKHSENVSSQQTPNDNNSYYPVTLQKQ